MENSDFIDLTNQALISTGILSIPILIPALVGGVLISLFQAVTQISEQTLTFVPKLIILITSYLVSGPWILRYMVNYATKIMNRLEEMGLPNS